MVGCRRDDPPLCLTLTGRTPARPQETLTLSFSGPALAKFPEALEDPSVERLDPTHCRILAGGSEWLIEARAVHLHYEVAAAFYRAVPPRAVPWGKRTFLRMVLALAARPWGKWLLLRLRRR